MRAVLLDLDGTLTDSAAGILGSLRAALRELGQEPDPAVDLTFVIGPPMADVMGSVLAPYGDDRVDEAVAAYRRHYGETGLFDAAVYDGAGDVLRTLQSAGCRLFLATAKRVDFAVRLLERFGLAGHFAGIYGSVPGGALDRKPDLIRHILAREGIDPADAVMVGDRRYDIAGARANGVRAIGATWGYGARQELEAEGADALADTLPDLVPLLLGPGAAVVRPAVRDDLPGLLEIYRAFRSFDPAYDATAAAPAWNAMAASGVVPLVAAVAGAVAATCTLAIVPNLTWSGRPYAVIENVATAPAHRRQGLGRRLLAYAADRAWAAGCYKVSLATGSTDDATLRFYEGAGFARNSKTFFEIRRT